VENLSLRKTATDNACVPEWTGMELGVTMPDGGQPVEENKDKEED